jgi:2,3-bisphosphoglycerate-independent phosphoglycerate mutase
VKYLVLIPDGAADLPVKELGGKTPMQAAEMPNLAALASRGRVGVAHTTPEGFDAGSDVCSMSLLGYDPAKYHTGRAPLEAAALGLTLAPADWIFRLNFVTTGTEGSNTGKMLDHSAGAISDGEARRLVTDLMAFWREREPGLVRGLALHPGVSYRNILVDSSGDEYRAIRTTPPHAIPGEAWRKHLPTGGTSACANITKLMLLSAEFLPTHTVNVERVQAGKKPATMAWIWGEGTAPTFPSFKSRFGLRGAMITSVDLLRGIAACMGWERIEVPGLTSYHDTDYKAQGEATVAALTKYDIVCCHVEAPDEASHQGDWRTKVASLEAIDREIVSRVVPALERFGDPEREAGRAGWRMLVMPDHFTLCSTKKHDATPVPLLMAGAFIKPGSSAMRFDEASAATSDLVIEQGHDLMEYFLRGGIVGARGK